MRTWIKKAFIRACWTAAQVAVPLIPAGIALWDINWVQIGGVVLTAFAFAFIKNAIQESKLYWKDIAEQEGENGLTLEEMGIQEVENDG